MSYRLLGLAVFTICSSAAAAAAPQNPVHDVADRAAKACIGCRCHRSGAVGSATTFAGTVRERSPVSCRTVTRRGPLDARLALQPARRLDRSRRLRPLASLASKRAGGGVVAARSVTPVPRQRGRCAGSAQRSRANDRAGQRARGVGAGGEYAGERRAPPQYGSCRSTAARSSRRRRRRQGGRDGEDP